MLNRTKVISSVKFSWDTLYTLREHASSLYYSMDNKHPINIFGQALNVPSIKNEYFLSMSQNIRTMDEKK